MMLSCIFYLFFFLNFAIEILRMAECERQIKWESLTVKMTHTHIHTDTRTENMTRDTIHLIIIILINERATKERISV